MQKGITTKHCLDIGQKRIKNEFTWGTTIVIAKPNGPNANHKSIKAVSQYYINVTDKVANKDPIAKEYAVQHNQPIIKEKAIF